MFRPKSPEDRRQLQIIGASGLLGVLFVTAGLFLKQRVRRDIYNNWESAAATISDVRTRPAAQANSQSGGAMLYDIQVFVKYKATGAEQERWVTVQKPMETASEARFDAVRWKGQRCFVHWKLSNPDQVVADVH